MIYRASIAITAIAAVIVLWSFAAVLGLSQELPRPPAIEWDTTSWWVVDIKDGDTLWAFEIEPRAIMDTMWSPTDIDSLWPAITNLWEAPDSLDSLARQDWVAIIDTVVPTRSHSSTLGPWPCRWLYYQKEVPCPPKPKTYLVINGQVMIRDGYTATLEYWPCSERDSVWHCAGDGEFAFPGEENKANGE